MRRRSKLLSGLILAFSMFAGCASAPPQPSVPQPEAPSQPDSPEAEASWIIEINDTQQICDEEGLIWNYTLSLYAVKAGGADALGSYKGDIALDVAPDMDSAKAMAAREGAELLSMLFRHHSEAKGLSFDIAAYSREAYSQMMASAAPDDPFLQLGGHVPSGEAAAVFPASFEAVQEPVEMTISDGESTYSGSAGGGRTTVTAPVDITLDGANAYCYVYETIHPLSRTFEGTLTCGDTEKTWEAEN